MLSGTTLIAAYNADAIVLAIDSRGHARNGIPQQGDFKKFHVIEEKFVVGTVGLIYCRDCREIEYKFENWISSLDTQLSALPFKTPDRIASALHKEMRKAIHPMMGFPESEIWKSYPDEDTLIQFVVAGFDYEGVPKVIKFGADIYRKQGKISDFPTEECPSPVIRGSEQYLRKVDHPGAERDVYIAAVRDIQSSRVTLPACARELLVDAVARIKVEAYFNNQHVGGTINAVVIGRNAAALSFAF